MLFEMLGDNDPSLSIKLAVERTADKVPDKRGAVLVGTQRP
jgi:hypothetical protein